MEHSPLAMRIQPPPCTLDEMLREANIRYFEEAGREVPESELPKASEFEDPDFRAFVKRYKAIHNQPREMDLRDILNTIPYEAA